MSGHCVAAKCPRKKCLGILLYSKYTDIIGTWGLSYKASVSILDTAKCVTACLLMIQGPAAISTHSHNEVS
jgi:hypothetical protein